jgi:hypothetical protein
MRPKTLAEVAKLTLQGESFDSCLANFLDEFYTRPNASALSDMPPLLAPKLGELGRVQDAYLAATAEELGRASELTIPSWTADLLFARAISSSAKTRLPARKSSSSTRRPSFGCHGRVIPRKYAPKRAPEHRLAACAPSGV